MLLADVLNSTYSICCGFVVDLLEAFDFQPAGTFLGDTGHFYIQRSSGQG